MSFYDIFHNLCKEKGVSIAQVSRDSKIAQSTIASWKSRKLTPNGETLNKLSDYFGVSIDYLLGKENSQASNESEFTEALLDAYINLLEKAVKVNKVMLKELKAYWSAFPEYDPGISDDDIKDLTN